MEKFFNQKNVNKITIFSGIATLITTVGYLIEKTSIFSIDLPLYFNIPFKTLLILAITFLTIFGIWSYYLSMKRYPIKDSIAIYTIKILNSKGDARISREVTFTVNTNNDITSRSHNTYSESIGVTVSEFDLKAWDASGNKLYCNITLDKPTYKQYDVHFPKAVSRGDEYTYTDQYNWKKVFDIKSDYWFLSDFAKNIEFHFVISKNWHLLFVSSEEAYIDGTKKELATKLKGRQLEDTDFVRHTYSMRKHQRHGRVKIEWNINPNFVPMDVIKPSDN